MLRWAFISLLISIVAAILGSAGTAVTAAVVAKLLFFIAISLFLVFLVGGYLTAGRR